MTGREKIIKLYSELGFILRSLSEGADSRYTDHGLKESIVNLKKAGSESCLNNPWFIPPFVDYALKSWGNALKEDKIRRWLAAYPDIPDSPAKPLRIAVVMAGNIPMVGFHDFLCVPASGNKLVARLSSHDNKLLPAIASIITCLEPALKDYISFTEEILKDFDAVIATGSNNTARYFEYYFGKYPHIIRKNRNSLAILNGKEDDETLARLADDIMIYFGLGCRNISKIYVPQGYHFDRLFHALSKYSFAADHNKFRNNYDYQKSIMIINGIPHNDNGFLLLKESASLISPLAILHYEYYEDYVALNDQLSSLRNDIQCIISDDDHITGRIPIGSGQYPDLWDYADGVDTMRFLLKIQ